MSFKEFWELFPENYREKLPGTVEVQLKRLKSTL